MIKLEYSPGRARGEGKLSQVFVNKVAREVSNRLKSKEEFIVSLALVDRNTMKRINGSFRGVDEVTDVLAFQYDELEMFGEVLICPARAREQAKASSVEIKREMTELLVHGLLHVFGYDHIEPKDAKKMLPLQKSIVDSVL